jgi:hypothetical protein
MRMFRSLVGLLVILSALAVAPLSRGQVVIYDNIGNNNPYVPNIGWWIGGSDDWETAFQFTSQASTYLDYAMLPVQFAVGALGPISINVALLADSGFNSPGALLETSSVVLPGFPGYQVAVPLSRVEFSNTTFLAAGTRYWLAASPINTFGFLTAWEAVGPVGLVARDTFEIGFSDAWTAPVSNLEGGMRIFGISNAPGAVPEPSTYGAIGGAFLLALVVTRRRSTRR